MRDRPRIAEQEIERAFAAVDGESEIDGNQAGTRLRLRIRRMICHPIDLAGELAHFRAVSHKRKRFGLGAGGQDQERGDGRRNCEHAKHVALPRCDVAQTMKRREERRTWVSPHRDP
jgi:hypothetical protein